MGTAGLAQYLLDKKDDSKEIEEFKKKLAEKKKRALENQETKNMDPEKSPEE